MARIQRLTLGVLVLLCGLLGCKAADDRGPSDEENAEFLVNQGKSDSTNGIEVRSWEASCVLRLVNAASFSVLYDEVDLWKSAANGIIAFRAGADGKLGTADDRQFETLYQLDDVSWIGYFSFRKLSNYARANGYCPGLAEEYPPAGESESVSKVIAIAETFLKTKYGAGTTMRRDAHPKSHGCLRASFTVDNRNLPTSMRVGLFAENKSYDAWMRMSNGSFNMQADKTGDVRGMAIKLLGVDGEKLLESEKNESTQDFLLISNPRLFVRNAIDYVEFSQKAFDGNPLSYFFSLDPNDVHLREFFVAVEIQLKKVANPLTIRYWSTTPYLLGTSAVKYSAKPCTSSDDQVLVTSDDYLRDAMRATLAFDDVCYDFMVQVQVDPEHQPIEDPSIEWDEADSPFIKVAELFIPQQSFDSDAQNTFCEHLSFTPWHSLPAHRPLGGINRARKTVYEALSTLRHSHNQVERREPTSLDIGN
ncbi:MAG: catalase family protein [Myxococcales bacterium]|nr:catalase family protein [Myxococcales bacterium]